MEQADQGHHIAQPGATFTLCSKCMAPPGVAQCTTWKAVGCGPI